MSDEDVKAEIVEMMHTGRVEFAPADKLGDYQPELERVKLAMAPHFMNEGQNPRIWASRMFVSDESCIGDFYITFPKFQDEMDQKFELLKQELGLPQLVKEMYFHEVCKLMREAPVQSDEGWVKERLWDCENCCGSEVEWDGKEHWVHSNGIRLCDMGGEQYSYYAIPDRKQISDAHRRLIPSASAKSAPYNPVEGCESCANSPNMGACTTHIWLGAASAKSEERSAAQGDGEWEKRWHELKANYDRVLSRCVTAEASVNADKDALRYAHANAEHNREQWDAAATRAEKSEADLAAAQERIRELESALRVTLGICEDGDTGAPFERVVTAMNAADAALRTYAAAKGKPK